MRASYTNLNIYAITINGVFVGNASARNSRSAIAIFCRSRGITLIRGGSYGECNMPMKYCSKSPCNGRRPCGRIGKCNTVYIAHTGAGVMKAIQTYMGDVR